MHRAALAMTRLLATVVLFAPSLAAQDVLVLRSGETLQGRLRTCNDDACTLDKRAIPRTGVAWIGLDVEGAKPPALGLSAADQVVLRDGTIRAGRFGGASLGAIVLGEEEIDREEVAWIRLGSNVLSGATDLPQKPVAVIDTVSMRDGSVLTGELVGCAGGSCLLDEGEIPRADIAAIAFGDGKATARAGERDLVMLRSGGGRPVDVYGVSPDDVVTAGGAIDRAEVAAILFAKPPDDDGEGQQKRPDEDERPDRPQEPELPPRVPELPTLPPAGAPPELANMLERGRLWSGTTQGRHWFEDGSVFIDRVFVAEGKLRERILSYRDAKGKVVGQNITLQPEGVVFTESYEYVNRTGEPYRCFGRGTTRSTGQIPMGAIVTKDADVDLAPIAGFDLERGKPLYILGHNPTPGAKFTVQCAARDRRWTAEERFTSATMGVWPTQQQAQSAVLFDARRQSVSGGRMQGQHEASDGFGAHSTLAWSWCREGTECPPPELPAATPPPFDPCGRTGQEAGLRDTCRQELARLVEALRRPVAEYNETLAAAQTNRAAFNEAMAWCELYDRSKELLEAIITGGAGPAAEGAKALLYLRDLIQKAQNGNLGSLFYPKLVKTFLDAYKKANNMWFELKADELSKMQRDLSACSGKMPLETERKAAQFLADLATAKKIWETKVAPGLNDLRTKALECAWRDHRAWRECRTAALCKGESPDKCGPEPSLDPDRGF